MLQRQHREALNDHALPPLISFEDLPDPKPSPTADEITRHLEECLSPSTAIHPTGVDHEPDQGKVCTATLPGASKVGH